MPNFSFIGFSILLMAGLLGACQSPAAEPEDHSSMVLPSSVNRPVVVDTAIARASNKLVNIRCSGVLKGAPAIRISSLANGPISQLFVREGDQVQKGQPILLIDTVLLAITHQENLQALAVAELRYEDLIRERGGADSIPPPLKERWQTEAGLESARLTALRSRLELQNATVVAPESGRIGQLHIRVGEHLSAGTTIADLHPSHHQEAELYLLPTTPSIPLQGHKMSIFLPESSSSIAGVVRAVLPEINAEGRIAVRVSLPTASSPLIAGRQVQGSFQATTSQQYPVVPVAAVLNRGNRQMVFTWKNGHADWHYVVTGAEDETGIRILEGIETGDIVLISGHEQLAHGEAVEIRH